MYSTPSSRPISQATNVSVELGGYQIALEEVLMWLLEAEDKLNNTIVTDGDLESVRKQFHIHEVLYVYHKFFGFLCVMLCNLYAKVTLKCPQICSSV